MKRIDSSTVELTDQERALSDLHSRMLDEGDDMVDGLIHAWVELGQYGWLPTGEFVDHLIGPAPEHIVDEATYLIHCLMVDCPDHGHVRFVDTDEVPSMAGGTDSHESWSCGCTVSTTPFSASRQRPDGTYTSEIDR